MSTSDYRQLVCTPHLIEALRRQGFTIQTPDPSIARNEKLAARNLANSKRMKRYYEEQKRLSMGESPLGKDPTPNGLTES